MWTLHSRTLNIWFLDIWSKTISSKKILRHFVKNKLDDILVTSDTQLPVLVASEVNEKLQEVHGKNHKGFDEMLHH